jgi:hypothetical protein
MSSSQFLHCCCYHNCCHPKHASYNLPPHTLTRQYENHKAATKPNIQMLCPQISLSLSLSLWALSPTNLPHLNFYLWCCLLLLHRFSTNVAPASHVEWQLWCYQASLSC